MAETETNSTDTTKKKKEKKKRSKSGIDTSKTTKDLINQAYMVNKNLIDCETTERVLITSDIDAFMESSDAVYNDVKAEFDAKKNEIMKYVDVDAAMAKMQAYINQKTQELNAKVDEGIHTLEQKAIDMGTQLAIKTAKAMTPGHGEPKNPIEEIQKFITKTKETFEYTKNVTLTSLQLMQSSILAGMVSSANRTKKKRDAKKAQKEYEKQQRLNEEMDAKKLASDVQKAKKHYNDLVAAIRQKYLREMGRRPNESDIKTELQQALQEAQNLYNVNLETGQRLHETQSQA